ncbi:putative glycosyltransferase EpsJ [Methanosarcinales archaeon]|nr:putative glycosyltransferase EpsJ [Methanosarcinales archaeon]
MLISFVVPAYNVSTSIGRTLDSVFTAKMPDDWSVEALVVDDGSSDGAELAVVVSRYPGARLLVHDKNRGMCAGRNTGIAASSGAVVSILDADDELVSDWAMTLKAVLEAWPTEVNVCYAACRNPEGRVTAQVPDYNGLLMLSDILNERYSGEYLPLFKGDYVRGKSYIDLEMRKSCGIVSYINFALDGPFWVTSRVLRIYHEARAGSVSAGWTTAKKARETALCYQKLFERYEDLYKREAPLVWRTKCLRLAVYLRFAGMTGAWSQWRKGASLTCVKETLGAFLILLVGASIGGRVAQLTKQIGLIRRYG